MPSRGTRSRQVGLRGADALFKAGRFAEAERVYLKALSADPLNYLATVRLGQVALLTNRLSPAQRLLSKAVRMNPDDHSAKQQLAEVFYRKDDFGRAARLFAAIGLEAISEKLGSFKGISPYRIEGARQTSRIKFAQTDPLPVIQLRINGGKELNFIIDTGGSEVFIDTDLAEEANVVKFGATTGVYGGGLQAQTDHGRVDSLRLGGFVIRDLPVHILSIRRFAVTASGQPVDGILGTSLLSHFIPTLDYPNGQLILRLRTAEALKKIEKRAKAEGQIVVPFWMAGDHYMVAWGRVNKSSPRLLLFDTGLAGGGFTAPASTIEEAGIELPEGEVVEGMGGGGKVRSVLFEVDELALGEAKEKGIIGFFGLFPAPLEQSLGFRIGGIISHQFFRSYAITMDFTGMRLFLKRKQS